MILVIEVIITQRVKVDKCIAEEIVYINSIGIRTEGCCCGHGDIPPHALIKPSSQEKAKYFGYNPQWHETGFYKIELKNKCQCTKGR